MIGCKKDAPVRPVSNDKFEANFNLSGELFRWETSDAGFMKNIRGSGDTVMTIIAGKGDRHLAISINNITTSGSYQFGPYNASQPQKIIIAQFAKNVSGIYGIWYFSTLSSLSGNITFQLTDNKISGTFNVVCTNGSDSVTVSNGMFEGDF